MKSILEESEYQIMWIMVMFDLPVESKAERRIATEFRNFLRDEGFEMAQFSVYMRFTGTKEQSQKYIKAVRNHAPDEGDICMLFFTDKQFSDIIHIENLNEGRLAEKPDQLLLF